MGKLGLVKSITSLEYMRLIGKHYPSPSGYTRMIVIQRQLRLGYELGADDYGTKPFSPKVLVARAKELMKRVEGRIMQR